MANYAPVDSEMLAGVSSFKSMASPAKACKQALQDATKKWPQRNRASDGIMGDAAHQKRRSDHNDGNAFDLTHDEAHGVDCSVLSRQVIKDSRVTYVIFAGEIYRRYKPQLGWVNYTGPNKHFHHMHVSIRPESRDDVSPWPWSPKNPTEDEVETLYSMPVLRLRSPMDRGESVKTLQRRLNAVVTSAPEKLEVDGIFGFEVDRWVRSFQHSRGLKVDGIVGPSTWKALTEK